MPRVYICPFFSKEQKKCVLTCDAARLKMPDKETFTAFVIRYCAGEWRHCTLAQALLWYGD